MTRSMTWTRPEDLSVDELASDTLLGVSSQVQTPTKSRSSRARSSSLDSAPQELSRFHSAMTISDTSEVPSPARPPPIPPLPSMYPIPSLPPVNPNHHQVAQRFHPAKLAKPKMPKKGKNPTSRFVISAPIAQDPGPQDPTLLAHFDGIHLQDIPTSRNTAVDAVNLNQKIANLVQQHAAYEAQNNAQTDKTTRPSPLQRGRNALAKATRALVIRISSSSSSLGNPASSSGREDTISGSNYGSLTTSADPSADNSPTRIELRRAEGENLSKDKVQRMMGDGFIKRKPLPGSIVTRPPSPDSYVEDPFIEEQIELLIAMSQPDYARSRPTRPSPERDNKAEASSSNGSLEANADSLEPPMAQAASHSTFPNAVLDKGKQVATMGPSTNAFDVATRMAHSISSDANSPQMRNPGELASASAPAASPTPRSSHGRKGPSDFSDSISGLAQHPDTMCFSTEPMPLILICSPILPDSCPTLAQSPDSEFQSSTTEPTPVTEDCSPISPTSCSTLPQNFDTEFHSSSPINFSTPRLRMEPQHTPDGKKRLAAVPVRDIPVFDFGFDELNDRDEFDGSSYPNRAASRRSSVKRKSATQDLRSRIGPAKRNKGASDLFDNLDEDPEQENDLFGTVSREVLTDKNKNREVSSSRNNSISANKGVDNEVALFRVKSGKGKIVAKEDKKTRMLEQNITTGQLPMFPRPKSGFHGHGQSSRTHRPHTLNSREVEIDELQTCDQVYQVRGKKRH